MPKIFIYSDDASSSLNLDLLVEFLESFNFQIENRGKFFDYLNLSEFELDDANSFFSLIRVFDIENPLDRIENLDIDEIEFEIKKMKELYSFRGDLYEGIWLQRKLYSVLATKFYSELNDDYIHVIYTGKLFGTFGTKRYHARVILTGVPSLISTSGLIEAPARPRDYYITKASYIKSERDISELDEIYKGRFLEYDDPKITKIVCSYTLQTIKYALTGEAFCDNSACSLYNSHWQEEVLEIQYNQNVCENCLKILSNTED